MCCRILGSKLELAFVNEVLVFLDSRWKNPVWKAKFIATQKNEQVDQFWEQIGFSIVGKSDQITEYQLSRKDINPKIPSYVEVFQYL